MKYRKIFSIKNEILNLDKIVFILGPRQVGKTTFLKSLYDDIKTDNKIFLNLENIDNHDIFQRPSNLINLISSKFKINETFYLFLDEFHKVKNIDRILKILWDDYKWIKIFASGSNNIEINSKIKESFAGRKRIINMYQLSFDEFLIWKYFDYNKVKEDEIIWLNKFKNIINKNIIYNGLEEFLIWGGYPRVVLATNEQEKQNELNDIFDYWLNRDIILQTEKIYEFNKFFEQMAFRNTNIVNFSEVAGLSNLSVPTIDRFIGLLEQTFIGFRIRPFFTNKLKELIKAPKFYFFDTGYRNWLIKRYKFSNDELGDLFENFVISEMIKTGKHFNNIKYWRTADGKYEIDLILDIEKKGIEIKYKDVIKESDKKGIKQFKSLYMDFNIEFYTKSNLYT